MKYDAEVYNKTVKIGKKRIKLKVHPKSRIPYFTNEDGEDVAIDANRTKLPRELRTPIKKSPILYQRISIYLQIFTLFEVRGTTETILLLRSRAEERQQQPAVCEETRNAEEIQKDQVSSSHQTCRG